MPMDLKQLKIRIDHQGFVIGIGQEHNQRRYWAVFQQERVVAEGLVERNKNNRAFRQAMVAAQAAIDGLLSA